MLVEQFKTQVVTPQGTTIEGISVLERFNIRYAVMKAVEQAYRKQKPSAKL